MSRPYYWTEYERSERRWERARRIAIVGAMVLWTVGILSLYGWLAF